MVHHIHRVPLRWAQVLSLFVWGDTQWRDEGDEGFDAQAWEAFRDDVKAAKRNGPVRLLGLGDYGDWLRPSMRSKVQSALSGDDDARQQADSMVQRKQESLLKLLSFMEGDLIGLHLGHHAWEFANGTNDTQWLCSALKTSYLGWMATTRLMLDGPIKSQGGHTYTIVSMHGTGNARYVTTDARWLEANIVPAFIADHYFRGHGCKAAAWEPFERQMVRRRGQAGVAKARVRCMTVGGFHKGYTDGHQTTYVEKAGFTPQPVSWGVVRFRFTQAQAKIEQAGLKTSCRGNNFLDIEQTTRGPGARLGQDD